MKTYNRCKKIKPLSAFYSHTSTQDKKQTYCKLCHKIKEWRKDNPEFLRAAADYIEEHQV